MSKIKIEKCSCDEECETITIEYKTTTKIKIINTTVYQINQLDNCTLLWLSLFNQRFLNRALNEISK